MMKKLFPLLLALVLCLTACGGPSKAQLQKLTEAYQQVSELYNSTAVTAQENGWEADAQTMTDLQTIAAALEPVGLALNGDMASLEGADFDALPGVLLEFLPSLQELSQKVSAPYEGDGAGVVTDEALKPLAEAYNQVAPLYNEAYDAAEANGWLNDEQTAAEIEAMNDTLSYIASGLTEDPAKLENADIPALVEQLEQLSPAFQELLERVSVPYGE